ncbi:MAG TPA: thioredoxin family protein [Tepidisphaeraceae bacterium]|nr:thioredoxin family protein [Tepidisphaeraceae bacterium]
MRNSLIALTIGLLCTTAFSAAAAPNWKEIVGPAQAKLPEPLAKIIWRTDLQKALAEAKEQNRPLLISLRCLPCKQCSAFDKDVMEGGPLLSPLLSQFITVRLTDAKAIDLRFLPVHGYQDLDISWWGYFLSPEGKLYAIFGGKDHVSDATRISPEALAVTMKRVLAHHYDSRREKWDIDGPAPDLSGEPRSTTTLPGYQAWFSRGGAETKKQECIHCHQVSEIIRQPAIDAGTFDKFRDTQIWPLPENVGIVLDRDDGLLVKSVQANSAGANAGIRAGDSLAVAGERRLFGQADFRGILHRGPQETGTIPVMWLRDGKLMSGELQVSEGWRKTILDWRMSISQGNIGHGPGFFPLAMSKAERQRFNIADDAMGVKPFIYKGSMATAAGLKANHMITAVNGQSPNVVGRSFEWWFRSHFNPGENVTLTVQEAPGKTREITYVIPKE